MRSASVQKNSGFTLFELSVVLVIIALITGGVLISKGMIRSSQLQSVIREYDIYAKAIREFQEKYQSLPGDMSTAQSMWGAYGSCGTYTATIPTSTATCNGDGDGRIGSSAPDSTYSDTDEWWGAWQHLSNAGLIDGRYTGVRGSINAAHAIVGTNIPASKLAPGGWTLRYYLNTVDTASMWGDQYGHMLNFGANASGGQPAIGAVITPSESLELDKKLDDGMPGKGKVRAWRPGTLSSCTTNDSSQSAATYNISDTSFSCSLIFILGF